jgi:Phosphotransferase enzyme family
VNLVERFLATDDGARAVNGWRPAGSIVLTPRFPDSRHVVVLLLDQAARPHIVGKVVRASGDPSTLDREADVLAAIGAGHSARIPPAFPRLLALKWMGGHRLMLQTAVPGTPVTHRDARRNPERLWRNVEIWMNRLPQEPVSAANHDWLETYILNDVALARRTLVEVGGMTPQIEQSMGLAIACVEALRAAVPHLVAEHGDLSHPNLMRSRDGLAVVDWETGEPVGLPGIDSATFLAFLEFAQARAHGVNAEAIVYQREMLAPAGRGRRRMIEHLDRKGTDSGLIDHILVTTWAKAALSVFSRLLTGPKRRNDSVRDRAVARFLGGRPFRLWQATQERLTI